MAMVTFLFFQTQATHEREHTQTQERLREAQRSDAELNEEVILVRFRLVGSFDGIVDRVAQLTRAQEALRSAVHQEFPQPPADMAASLNAYADIVGQKQALIERFKATDAILSNSLNYYPLANSRLSSELNARNGLPSLTVDIDRVDHNILLYNLTRDDTLKGQTEALVAKLCRAYRSYPPEVQDDLAILLKHAHSILRRKAEVDALLAAIIALSTDEANDGLYRVEQAHYRELRRYSSRCRYGIYLACLILICYVAYILVNLNSQRQALRLANDDLEQRIARRTKALQESQERYEVAVSGSNEGIWDWDLPTNGVFFSQRYKELLGFTEEEFSNHQDTFIDRLHPDDTARIQADIQAHLSGLAPFLMHDFRLRTKCGEYRWFHGRGQALRDKESRAYRVAGSITDITERKMLETQLALAQKMESIGQLAAGIAHEINTPIQYIGDNIRFLKESFLAFRTLHTTYVTLIGSAGDEEDSTERAARARAAAEEADIEYLLEEIPRSIDQALEGVERVSTIVRAMKEFSHPGTAEKTPIDINHALASTLTVAQNEWKYAAEVVTDFEAGLPLVSCLPGDVNQVFLNLIVNAAHAITEVMQESGSKGLISVRTRREGDTVEIRIQDTGAGIPEPVRDRIFDPFFTTKEVGKGTGQGLAIAHSIIVEKHGGTIAFDTEVGTGTTFVLRLPLPTRESSWMEAA